MPNDDFVATDSKFLVDADAICGAGRVFKRGQIIEWDCLGEYVSPLLEKGALVPLPEESEVLTGIFVS